MMVLRVRWKEAAKQMDYTNASHRARLLGLVCSVTWDGRLPVWEVRRG